MFSEVVKLKPQVDRSELETLFSSLNKRFGDVAKKFGQGMKNALRLAPFIAVGGAILSRLLNPLQKAEDILDRVLKTGQDAETTATDLGTTPGKLLRLEAVGKARGVDPDTLRLLIQHFQTALSKEQEIVREPQVLQKKLDALPEDDPQRRILIAQIKEAQTAAATPGALRNFVNEKDTAEAFFKFIQNLGKVEPARRAVVEQEIFGERVRGRALRLIDSTPAQLDSILSKLPSAESLGAAADKTGGLADLRDVISSVRDAKDFVSKAGLVNESQVKGVDTLQGEQNLRDDEQLRRFNELKNSVVSIDKLTDKFDKFATELTNELLPELTKAINAISNVVPNVSDAKKDINSIVDPVLQAGASATVTVQDLLNWRDRQDDKILNWLNETWAEFKTSRLYRFLGGG